MARLIALFPLLGSGMKCADVKDQYKAFECCGNPENEVSTLMEGSACPYNFVKPACADAGVQAPRNVSDGSIGMKPARFAPLDMMQMEKLQQTNVHLHLGAEHFSGGEYDIPGADHAHRRLEEGSAIRPGYFCNTGDHDVEDKYEFQYCKDVHVGETYEVHWVFSSAGVLGEDPWLTDGLGQAANGRALLNPIIGVQAQVFFVVNEDEYDYGEDMLYGGVKSIAMDFVRYAGSTTGTSHDNEVCSPYAVTWMVDRKCHPISARALDHMCKGMQDLYMMNADLHPHGSRELVHPDFVVPFDEVAVERMP